MLDITPKATFVMRKMLLNRDVFRNTCNVLLEQQP